MSDSARRWLIAGLAVVAFILSIVLLTRFSAPEWAIETVKYGFIGGFIFLVQQGIANRKPRENYRKPGELRQPLHVLVVGIVGVGFFGALFGYLVLWAKEAAEAWVYLAFAVFVTGSLFLILEWIYGRHTLTETGLIHRSAWGRTTEFRWDEVERWTTHPFVQMMRLRIRGRGHRWMHTSLDGLAELAHKALPLLPQGALSPMARAELESWSPPPN